MVGVIPGPHLVNGLIAFESPNPTSAPVWGTYCPPQEEEK
jgi:hypothetical protein